MIELHDYPLPDIKFTDTSLQMVIPYSWIISGVVICAVSFLILYWWIFYEPSMRGD